MYMTAKTITITLDDVVLEKLDVEILACAKSTEDTRSTYINRLLIDKLRNMSSVYGN